MFIWSMLGQGNVDGFFFISAEDTSMGLGEVEVVVKVKKSVFCEGKTPKKHGQTEARSPRRALAQVLCCDYTCIMSTAEKYLGDFLVDRIPCVCGAPRRQSGRQNGHFGMFSPYRHKRTPKNGKGKTGW